MTSTFRSIALTDLRLSNTAAQTERRKHIDQAKIAELAESLTTHGLVQAIVVRPLAGNGSFEIVAGERRFLAAKHAKLREIMCAVRELTDVEAIEIQLIENLQREDIHALAEAEGYEALQKRGHTVDEMADKVGKSKGTIYARMKLLALCPEARRAFYEGKLDASRALLLARIPHAALQKKALEEITHVDWSGSGMSFRRASEHVHDKYMLRLDQAGFPTGDSTLVPAAGPCGSCPKRTGNQAELFGDVKSANVCTDPICFKAKKDANAVRLVEKAKASGKEVISGAAAKKIMPHGMRNSLKGYVNLDSHCYEDSKQRPYRKVIGEDVEMVYLQDQESGELVQVATESSVKAALKKRGIGRRSSANDSYQAGEARRRKKAQIDNLFRKALFLAVREKLPAKLGRPELEQVALRIFHRLENETARLFLGVIGVEVKKQKGYGGYDTEGAVKAHVPKLSDAALARFTQECVLAPELRSNSWADTKPLELIAIAKRLRLNVEKIRKDNAPATAKAKAKK